MNEQPPSTPKAPPASPAPASPADRVRGAAERLGVLGGLRTLRRLPDRLLHERRRKALVRSLRERPTPQNILFICQGNIYRSPFAEYVFRASLPPAVRSSIRTSSAGFVGPGRSCPPDALSVAAARGVEMAMHTSSLLTANRVREADLIVVVDPVQKRSLVRRFPVSTERIIVLGDLDPHPIDTRAITDPWGRNIRVLRGSYRRIERCIRVLASTILSPQPAP